LLKEHRHSVKPAQDCVRGVIEQRHACRIPINPYASKSDVAGGLKVKDGACTNMDHILLGNSEGIVCVPEDCGCRFIRLSLLRGDHTVYVPTQLRYVAGGP
jgi:hypothetical protein